jgi:hypothetical protein
LAGYLGSETDLDTAVAALNLQFRDASLLGDLNQFSNLI